MNSLASAQPQQPFRGLAGLPENTLGLVGRSLITHIQSFDLERDQGAFETVETSGNTPAAFEAEFSQSIALPFVSRDGGFTPQHSEDNADSSSDFECGVQAGKNHSRVPNTTVTDETSEEEGMSLPTPAWLQGGPTGPAWVNTGLLVPFTRVLWQILLQTADCMRCSQFELRRISSMVSGQACSVPIALSAPLLFCYSRIALCHPPSAFLLARFPIIFFAALFVYFEG